MRLSATACTSRRPSRFCNRSWRTRRPTTRGCTPACRRRRSTTRAWRRSRQPRIPQRWTTSISCASPITGITTSRRTTRTSSSTRPSTATEVVLLGHPVAHSLSPRMQNAAFAAAGLDWQYVARDVLPEELEAAVREAEYANVTAPYKLDAARILGSDLPSVNTIVRGRGLSTDAAVLKQVTSCHKPAIVGDGGAAAAFREALPKARVFSRRGDWPPEVGGADLVVHATPVRDEIVFELGEGQTLVDLPYPRTATAEAAAAAGAPGLHGLEGPVAPGGPSVEPWAGRPAWRGAPRARGWGRGGRGGSTRGAARSACPDAKRGIEGHDAALQGRRGRRAGRVPLLPACGQKRNSSCTPPPHALQRRIVPFYAPFRIRASRARGASRRPAPAPPSPAPSSRRPAPRGPPGPGLDARAARRHGPLEAVEARCSRRGSRLRRRRARVREIDQRLPLPQLEHDLVPHRRRVHDEIRAADLRRPVTAPGEHARLRQRLPERRRRPAVADDRGLVTTCHLLEDGGVSGKAAAAHDGVHRRQVAAEDPRGVQLVRRRHVRVLGLPHRGLELLRQNVARDVLPIQPRRREGRVLH